MKGLSYNIRLVLLALFLTLIWLVSGFKMPHSEARVWNTVRNGQNELWNQQTLAGVPLSVKDDRLKTGFIGVEWSPLTTTLGNLEAKRTSCNPLWAAQFLDWFDELGLKPGDPIVIYSSSSFPGLLFSAIVAAESRELEILLAVSLGSSMWGANRPEFTWVQISQTLLRSGSIKTRAAFYTPGGAAESGRDMPAEVIQLLSEISDAEGTPLIILEKIEQVIQYKSQKMLAFKPKLLISIGGSNANLGDSAEAADIPNGLLLPNDNGSYPRGDGVIAVALSSGIPTLNMLNIRKLALESGIQWDAGIFVKTRYSLNPLIALLGLLAFFAVLQTYKRWSWQEEDGGKLNSRAEEPY